MTSSQRKNILIVISLIIVVLLGIFISKVPTPAEEAQSAIEYDKGRDIYDRLVKEGIISQEEIKGGIVEDGKIHLPLRDDKENFFGSMLNSLENLRAD